MRAKGNTSPQGIETNDEVIRESGVTFPLWQFYQHFWLIICLFFPLASLVSKPDAWLRLAVGSTALLFFEISYTWIMWPHPASRGARTRGRSRLSLLLLVALGLQVTVFSLLDDPAWLWLFLGVSAIAGVLLPMRRAGIVVVLMLLVRGLGLDMIGVSRMGSAIRELHTARRAPARMKVEEERLRLARDLHDLLGQTLSVITLKSELARGLITEDPARCAQELSEIEQVGRMTLREVRKTVAGYRQPRLSSELDDARQLLEAAGIAYDIEKLHGELPQPLDAVLAWTMREGVTNVIRHRPLSLTRGTASPKPCSSTGKTGGMSMIRVLLAEDQAMVRGALAALLCREQDIEVVAEVARGDEVVEAALATQPDVALLDIEMPGGDGLTAAQALREALPTCRVVILTTFGRSGYLRRAMESGAAGFLLKDAPASELALALRRVMKGERVVDPDLALSALTSGHNPLTTRERDVLSASLFGASIAEIAMRLWLSEGTVRNHLSTAMQKMGAQNRMEAARLAEQKGWL